MERIWGEMKRRKGNRRFGERREGEGREGEKGCSVVDPEPPFLAGAVKKGASTAPALACV